jgi:hypothetical protein
MFATQTSAWLAEGSVLGDLRVQFRSDRSGVIAALALAVALSGCGNIDYDPNARWFSKPLDVSGRNAGGYTFSELAESKTRQRPITPADLVDNNGACAPQAAPQAPPAPGNQAATPPAAPDTSSLLGGGVALGMSECDVVFRVGQPTAVQLGKNPNGDRTAVFTVQAGPRPGIYHFERGALMEMDSVQVTAAPPQPAKKSTAKSTKPSKKSAQS